MKANPRSFFRLAALGSAPVQSARRPPVGALGTWRARFQAARQALRRIELHARSLRLGFASGSPRVQPDVNVR